MRQELGHRDQATDPSAGLSSPELTTAGPHGPAHADGAKQLDLCTVLEELAAISGATATVEIHASGTDPAPRAILSGTVGTLSMDGEPDTAEPRGLVFVPIGAEGPTDPGCRPGIYFHEERFAWAERSSALTIALDDQTFFVINTEA